MFIALASIPAFAIAGDWPQWRGEGRNGVDADSPPLIESLPRQGFSRSGSVSQSSRRGTGDSPPRSLLTGGVYLFCPRTRTTRETGTGQYPYLSPDKRTGCRRGVCQIRADRRDESERRARAYAFKEIVYCLDAESGETQWKNVRDSVYSRWPQSGSPVVAGGRLYVLGGARIMRCVDAVPARTSGRLRFPGEFRDEYWQASPALWTESSSSWPIICLDCQQLTDAFSGKETPNDSRGRTAVPSLGCRRPPVADRQRLWGPHRLH